MNGGVKMKDTEYAYAVARIRANEKKLLSQTDVERLVTASSYGEAVSLLKSRGWSFESENEDFKAAISKKQNELWRLLCECVADKARLTVLCVQNDFFNLKAALKCMITNRSAEPLFAFPTSLDLEALEKAVVSHDFDALPEEMRSPAKEAYDAACRTENGQSADIIVDKASLELFSKLCRESKSPILEELGEYICTCANLKIAFRSARAKKSLSFIENALCRAGSADVTRLAKSAAKGTEELLEYLFSTSFSKEAELLSKSDAAFEKQCDDKVTEIVKKAKYEFFGFEPIAAYYYAVQAEIKTVRVVLASKLSGVSEEIIRERVRALYV